MSSQAEHSPFTTSERDTDEVGERGRVSERERARNCSVSEEQLPLGKHIEPSGQHIHQHTECQSAAAASYPASLLGYCYYGKVGRGVTGRLLQSRLGPVSLLFGCANVSMHGSGGFYEHFSCPNRLAVGC